MGLARYQHYLKDNKQTEYPYHYIFFDTETNQTQLNDTDIEHTLKLGVAIYWRRGDSGVKEQLRYHPFYTVEDFWHFVTGKCTAKRRILLIAHNLPFDMGIVKGWKWLENLGFKPVKIILDFNCNIWKFRKDNVTLMFIDNMNYFQTSLEVLGDSIGIKKLPMPSPNDSNDAWVNYCTRDVEVLLKAWQTWLKFVHDYDLGSFGFTIASQALNAFRHRFMPVQIGIHTSSKAINLEREAYRGGRNECFRIGKFHGGRFYLVDVNSMYPYVMSTYEYPCNLVSTGCELTLQAAQDFTHDYCLIAECDISTNEACYGVKEKGKLLFPIGQFPAVLTTNEIVKGLMCGYITGMHNYALYSKAKLFDRYVSFFYSSRLDFEKRRVFAFAYLCKIMLNSLYGKFGQRVEDWRFVCEDITRDYDWWQEYDIQDKCVYTYRCINHCVEVSTGYHEGYNSLVAISAEVTANARLYLWHLAETAGLSHVFYMDTDSLIVDDTGLERLSNFMEVTTLGKLKLVGDTDSLEIYNLKDYSFGGKVKIKGVRRDAELIDYNKYKQMQSLGIKSGLHLHDINRVIWHEVTKELRRDYTKGEVQTDGRVTPIRLFRTGK